MPTTVTKTIGSGGDYSTIALWEADTDNDLVTADQIQVGACKNETFGSGTGNVVTIGGATVDSTRFRKLTTDTGASFRDNANVQTNALRYNASNGAAIDGGDNYSFPIDIQEQYVQLVGLQVLKDTGTGARAAVNINAANPTIDFCIIESVFRVVESLNGGCKIRNSLLVGRASSIANLVILQTGGGSEGVYNCTLAVPSDLTAATTGINCAYNSGGVTIRNTAVFGVTNAQANGSSITMTTCYCDDDTPPTGFTDISYSTSAGTYFQNISNGTHDYRIKTDSTMKDNGTTDSTHAAIDIAGTARPSGSAYDVGCWEFVAAAGGAAEKNFLTLLGVGA